MQKINIQIESTIKFTTRDGIDYLEWDTNHEIPMLFKYSCQCTNDCECECALEDIDEDEYLYEIEGYIASQFDREYGPSLISIDIEYIKLISATEEKTQYVHYFE